MSNNYFNEKKKIENKTNEEIMIFYRNFSLITYL